MLQTSVYLIRPSTSSIELIYYRFIYFRDAGLAGALHTSVPSVDVRQQSKHVRSIKAFRRLSQQITKTGKKRSGTWHFVLNEQKFCTHPPCRKPALVHKRNNYFSSNTINPAASWVLRPITVPQRPRAATVSKIVDSARAKRCNLRAKQRLQLMTAVARQKRILRIPH